MPDSNSKPMSSPKVLVETLGCKANAFDSQLIQSQFLSRGWEVANSHTPADEIALYVVNSCTVTNEADRQSRRFARLASKKYPNAKTVFTGCSAEVDPSSNLLNVNYVVSNREKPNLAELVETQKNAGPQLNPSLLGKTEGYSEMRSRHPMDRDWPLTHEMPGLESNGFHTRSFLRVQEGCNAFCTYCVIPYGRGPSRSLPPEQIVTAVQNLCSVGAREVVLTGTNLGDFGNTEGVGTGDSSNLLNLLKLLLDQSTIERIRLTSLSPTELSKSLIEFVRANPRVCPHFHVSLQSPSSKILKLMKRRYSSVEFKDCIETIHQSLFSGEAAFVGMDVITGFPGETEADFEDGVRLLNDLPWSRLHVFPYSERTGTAALNLKGSIPFSERKRRAQVLNEMSLKRLQKFYSQRLELSTQISDVLFEGSSRGPDRREGWVSGYSPHYYRVWVSPELLNELGAENLKNQVLPVDVDQIWVNNAHQDASFVAKAVKTPLGS